jgi:hypothetical protein
VQSVQWGDDVVDNEFMNKKKSKSENILSVPLPGPLTCFAALSLRSETLPSFPPFSAECCIFHKQRAFGEWSDDSDSDVECESCIQEEANTSQKN